MTGNNKHCKTAFWPLAARLWIKTAPQDLKIAHSLTQSKAFHQHASVNSLGRMTYLEAADAQREPNPPRVHLSQVSENTQEEVGTGQ